MIGSVAQDSGAHDEFARLGESAPRFTVAVTGARLKAHTVIPLFRREVLAARKDRLDGDISLAVPIAARRTRPCSSSSSKLRLTVSSVYATACVL